MFSWGQAARETLKVYREIVTGEVGATSPVPAAYHSSTS